MSYPVFIKVIEMVFCEKAHSKVHKIIVTICLKNLDISENFSKETEGFVQKSGKNHVKENCLLLTSHSGLALHHLF